MSKSKVLEKEVEELLGKEVEEELEKGVEEELEETLKDILKKFELTQCSKCNKARLIFFSLKEKINHLGHVFKSDFKKLRL